MKTPLGVAHAIPADQPHSVHQLTHRLFNAYRVDEGHVYLAGCALSDRVFGRLEYRFGDELQDIYVDSEGAEVSAAVRDQLGLASLEPLARPPRPFESEMVRMIEGGWRIALQASCGEQEPVLELATVIWGKFVEGKLRFAIGVRSVDLAFSGWARGLQPPPFHCPYADIDTYHLAATHDGRIVAAEEIRHCDETGRSILAEELISCTVSGRRVASDLIEVCPVTGQRASTAMMTVCGVCRQRVAPRALSGGVCLACHNVQRVSTTDPRMARLLFEHPELDRWGHWRMSETATVYILVGSRWLKRLLVVIDRDSLELKVMATSNRILGNWDFVAPEQFHLVVTD